MNNNQGFTLVELLVTIGIVAILMSITLIALNPEKQFRSAREAKRMADVSVLLNGVSQYLIDHKTEDTIPKDKPLDLKALNNVERAQAIEELNNIRSIAFLNVISAMFKRLQISNRTYLTITISLL